MTSQEQEAVEWLVTLYRTLDRKETVQPGYVQMVVEGLGSVPITKKVIKEAQTRCKQVKRSR